MLTCISWQVVCQMAYIHIESQNNRVVEVGRNLWRSYSLTHLPKQGGLELVPQDCVPYSF